MSDHADLLRRAAARIRETAQAATEGPWAIWDDLSDHGYVTVGDAQGVLTDERPFTEECNPVAHVYAQEDADHIALWHPGVALVVADWLDCEAQYPPFHHALSVACTVLGEEPTE